MAGRSPPEITRLDALYQGWTTLHLATIRAADGQKIKREIEDHGPAVGALPYDPERRVALLIRQMRVPALHEAGESNLLECPAGLLEEGTPEDNMLRELWEEVGLKLAKLEPVVAGWSMPGLSTERIHLFLAPYSRQDRSGAGGGLESEHEDITAEEVPLAKLAAMADDGRLTDIKTLLLVQTLRLRRPELFSG